MNPVHHKRTKHIDIRYHFIRKHTCEDSTIKFVSIPTNKQVADHFTKGLPSPAFLRHLDVYMGYLNSFLRQLGKGCKSNDSGDGPSQSEKSDKKNEKKPLKLKTKQNNYFFITRSSGKAYEVQCAPENFALQMVEHYRAKTPAPTFNDEVQFQCTVTNSFKRKPWAIRSRHFSQRENIQRPECKFV